MSALLVVGARWVPAHADPAPAPTGTAAFPLEPAPPAGGGGAPPRPPAQSFGPTPPPAPPLQPPPRAAAPYPYGPPPGYYYGYGGYPAAPANVPAYTAAPPPRPAKPSRRSLSITWSPLYLVFPVVELTAEVRPVDGLGLAVVGGIGSMSPTWIERVFGDIAHLSEVGDRSFAAREIGGQLLWYPLRPFDGLTLGAEVYYFHLSAEDSSEGASAKCSATAIGPLIGYKWIAAGGFTLLAQAGVQHASLSAEARSTVRDFSASADDSRFIPLLNLNLGWSF